MNRTIQLGNHTHSCIDVDRFVVDSICMQNTQNTNRKNTINGSESLLHLLSERLDLWDQQDAAQRDSEFHKALLLERRIRQLNKVIRMIMGLEEGVPVGQGL